jgi:hypothetical protein
MKPFASFMTTVTAACYKPMTKTEIFELQQKFAHIEDQ